LTSVCNSLNDARKHAANTRQDSFLLSCQESFRTGSIEDYRESQRLWVKDLQPSVEAILGFVEPYRDPMGIRAEFEGMVAITNKEETKTLTKLVGNSDKFIRRLPWALGYTENNGKGPFEKELFEKPDFTSLHSKPSAQGSCPCLTICSASLLVLIYLMYTPLMNSIMNYAWLISAVQRHPTRSRLQECHDHK
jgi:hypothetical protein